MKIYAEIPQPSRGLDRIRSALVRYCPDDVEFVKDERVADLVVIYAIGRRDRIERQAKQILSRGQRYAVIQVCLRSTMSPSTRDWLAVWQQAEVTWSYYDLEQAMWDDGNRKGSQVPHFYHAPLGADADVFDGAHAGLKANKFIIATSGESRLSESVRECWLAAEAVDREVIHLGPLHPPKHVTPINNATDGQLAVYYANCEFVSGLRRTEGFELPAVEGLLCGARPIVFDTPDYRWCYGDHAEYVHEGTRAEVVDQLVTLFRRGARGVTEEERADAVERFNWATIIGGFYDRLGAGARTVAADTSIWHLTH